MSDVCSGPLSCSNVMLAQDGDDNGLKRLREYVFHDWAVNWKIFETFLKDKHLQNIAAAQRVKAYVEKNNMTNKHARKFIPCPSEGAKHNPTFQRIL